MFTTLVMWFHPFAHAYTQAGSFLCKHAQCVSLTQQEVFPHEVSFQGGREVMLQREMRPRHKAAGGKWRLIKSLGFPGSFLGTDGNLNAPPIWEVTLMSEKDGRGHYHGFLNLHEYTQFFLIRFLAADGFIESHVCIWLNYRQGGTER